MESGGIGGMEGAEVLLISICNNHLSKIFDKTVLQILKMFSGIYHTK